MSPSAVTTPSLSPDTIKALRVFREGVSGIVRSNSRQYKGAVSQIEGSEKPLSEASRLVRDFTKAHKRQKVYALSDAVEAIYLAHDRHVSTVTLEAIVDLVRSGYPTKALDPQHSAIIARYENEVVFQGKATLANLVELATLLVKLDVYDPKGCRWVSYRG